MGGSKLCSRERESITAIVLGVAKVACGPYSFKDIAKRTQFGDMTGPRDYQSAEALRSLGRFGPHSDSSPATDTDWWRDILVSRPVRSIVSSSDHRLIPARLLGTNVGTEVVDSAKTSKSEILDVPIPPCLSL